MLKKGALFLCLVGADAQQAGTNKKEEHIPMAYTECTKDGGCKKKGLAVTMDAQWRWLHDAHPNKYANCIQGEAPWDETIVGNDPKQAARNCAIEGISTQDYEGTYGVEAIKNGISLRYVTGTAVGSRLYLMESADKYLKVNMMNREFTMDVDVSELECGMNGAVYFVEMDADGGKGKGDNTAGAQYGTGYCDAQCPHDLKFIEGEANLLDWHMTGAGPLGRYGSCCSEMDIWEANKESTAYTVHYCDTKGIERCTDNKTCGWTEDSCTCCDTPDKCDCCNRFKGVCDKDGCDYNHYRLGDKKFFCAGSDCTVDSSRPFTLVTQFITTDGTDDGDLKEIRRYYVQDGKKIENSKAFDDKFDSITDDFCQTQKNEFDNYDDFTPKGKLKAMGETLKRGHVLVLSLWDDELTHMLWLDSAAPPNEPDKYPFTKPGVVRGPCAVDAGKPGDLRGPFANAKVKYSNLMLGEIGSTFMTKSSDEARTSPSPVTPQSVLKAAPPSAEKPMTETDQNNYPSQWGQHNDDAPTNDGWANHPGDPIRKPDGHPDGEPMVEPKTGMTSHHKCCTAPKTQGKVDDGCWSWGEGWCEKNADNCRECAPSCSNCYVGAGMVAEYEARARMGQAKSMPTNVMMIGFVAVGAFLVAVAVVASKRLKSSRSVSADSAIEQKELLPEPHDA